jgi:UDP-N-acetyl-D-glucosamine dehydrogenase
VAFKPNVRDARNSPAADILAGLAARGATVSFHDPHVPTFTDGQDTTRKSVGFDELLAGSDVVVVVTPHRDIDFGAVYERAELVVDTVNSSHGRDVRARQVLRLGAGWSAG